MKGHDLGDGLPGVDEKMARNTKSKPNAEVKVSIALLEIFAPNEAPARRPISMRNQYVPTTKPEMVEEMPAPTICSRLHDLVVTGSK